MTHKVEPLDTTFIESSLVKLRVCPYCGGKVRLSDSAETGSNIKPFSVSIYCPSCHTCGPGFVYNWRLWNIFGVDCVKLSRNEARAMAVALWNSRSPRSYRKAYESISAMLHNKAGVYI